MGFKIVDFPDKDREKVSMKSIVEETFSSGERQLSRQP
jgi:hypothetical protein